jgi:hypothetical protein
LQVLVAEAGAGAGSQVNDGDSESSGLLSFRFHPPRHVQSFQLSSSLPSTASASVYFV